jgi:hypothetical protein
LREQASPSHRDGGLADAIDKIFRPAEQDGPRLHESETSERDASEPSDRSPVQDRWEEAERMLDRAMGNEEPPLDESDDEGQSVAERAENDASIVEAEAVEQATGDSPEVVRASVVRALPPDDSDLLVIIDEDSESDSLDKTPARTRRREYRDLFTRLREN